jgi:hypothetical protein
MTPDPPDGRGDSGRPPKADTSAARGCKKRPSRQPSDPPRRPRRGVLRFEGVSVALETGGRYPEILAAPSEDTEGRSRVRTGSRHT